MYLQVQQDYITQMEQDLTWKQSHLEQMQNVAV